MKIFPCILFFSLFFAQNLWAIICINRHYEFDTLAPGVVEWTYFENDDRRGTDTSYKSELIQTLNTEYQDNDLVFVGGSSFVVAEVV